MSQQYKWEVTIKYTRNPFQKDGTQNMKAKESVTWFTTIYDNNDRLTEGKAKDKAKQQFLTNKITHIKIESIRVSKKEAY